jgi:hypothetical protein
MRAKSKLGIADDDDDDDNDDAATFPFLLTPSNHIKTMAPCP